MKRSVARWLSAGLAVVLSGGLALGPVAPAQAMTVGDVFTYAGYAKTAYDAYELLFGDQLSVRDATNKILTALTNAQTQIIAEIGRVQADLVRSCARTAVIDVAAIDGMNPDTLQAFATSTTSCVTDGWSLIDNTSDLGAVDEMGFALNVVGPIALLARSRAYGVGTSTELLKGTIIEANRRNLVRLTPSCSAIPGEVVGGIREYGLRCTAYNGDTGDGFARVPVGSPLPDFDYSALITTAMQRTSYPISIASVDGLIPDPAVTQPADQTTIYGTPVSLTLAATGGHPPYRWTATGLPSGLSISTQGMVTGTPDLVHAFTVSITVTDAQDQHATAQFAWTVVERLAIPPGPLGDRTTVVGTQMTSTAPVATGGTAPYIWSVTGLPAGLSADAAGRVSGTVGPSPYTNLVTFTAHDAGGQAATRTITWTVPVAVPTVTGSTRTMAQNAILAAGLSVGQVSTARNCASPGDVVSQSPSGGTQQPPGSAVNITVGTCSGPRP
jgi:Putative Ig domain/PASTA domain